ncbi:hypothetical protein TNCV_3595011 [Trichonephila clavipes]|nr:hypothetical protein TNCV_3595011 [Trichonephila clavipes]
MVLPFSIRQTRCQKPQMAGAVGQDLQRQKSTRHELKKWFTIFQNDSIFPVSEVEGALIWQKVLFRQCCENIRRDVAQWTRT